MRVIIFKSYYLWSRETKMLLDESREHCPQCLIMQQSDSLRGIGYNYSFDYAKQNGRHGILIFSCLLFVLFEMFLLHHGILMEKENLIFYTKLLNLEILIGSCLIPCHSAFVLWSVWGFLSLYYLHAKISRYELFYHPYHH